MGATDADAGAAQLQFLNGTMSRESRNLAANFTPFFKAERGRGAKRRGRAERV